ncbi:MAG: gliding motility lipoprotein GldD [Prevotellaceae bacterium]|nr:gliding motility lipoprotein GldD [Prevotellaceae bacterium]
MMKIFKNLHFRDTSGIEKNNLLKINHIYARSVAYIVENCAAIPFILTVAMLSCTNYIPKPVGYMRFDLPEKQYRLFDSLCPYSFDIPTYSTMIPNPENKYWYNLYFPRYSATVYLSYVAVKNNLNVLLDDSHEFVYKHTVKANTIGDRIIQNDRSIGMLFEIDGNSATPLQFFVTDSAKHFLRGSLYFYSAPNRDSLLPLINFFKTDIEHLMETVEFNDNYID